MAESNETGTPGGRVDEQTRAQAYQLFTEIGIIAQLSSHQRERLLPHDLTLSQFSVLNWFHRVDTSASPTRLARAFQVTRGAMTNTLGKLEDKGFIRVVPDPDSGRAKVVTITAAGSAARAEAIEAVMPVIETFARAMPPGLIESLVPGLEIIRRWLDAERDRS